MIRSARVTAAAATTPSELWSIHGATSTPDPKASGAKRADRNPIDREGAVPNR